MPDPQTTVSVFQGFVEADRAKKLLEAKGILAILVEAESSPFLNTTDVVHLRVAESDASRALEILVAAGNIPPPGGSDPDFDPPSVGDTTCRCPACGRAFSTDYDFCPYCEPPADWLAAAIPKRPAIENYHAHGQEEAREEPHTSPRDILAELALYFALAGLCCWPLALASTSLVLVLCVAFTRGKMRPESRMSVYICATLSAIELVILLLAVWSLWERLTG
jgi:hypothetical protein